LDMVWWRGLSPVLVKFYSVVIFLSIAGLLAGLFAAIVKFELLYLAAVSAVGLLISLVGRRYCIYDMIDVKNRALANMVQKAQGMFPNTAWRLYPQPSASCCSFARSPDERGRCQHCSHFDYVGYMIVQCGPLVQIQQVGVAVPVMYSPTVNVNHPGFGANGPPPPYQSNSASPVTYQSPDDYAVVKPGKPSSSDYDVTKPAKDPYDASKPTSGGGGNHVHVDVVVIPDDTRGGGGGGTGYTQMPSPRSSNLAAASPSSGPRLLQCSKCGQINNNPSNAFCGKCGNRLQ